MDRDYGAICNILLATDKVVVHISPRKRSLIIDMECQSSCMANVLGDSNCNCCVGFICCIHDVSTLEQNAGNAIHSQ